MSQSGDPRKQPRPDARPGAAVAMADTIAALTAAFPPNVGGVITSFGATPIAFPAFTGGKAIRVELHCGPLVGHFIVDPDAVEVLREELQTAKRKADTGLIPATLADVEAEAERRETNGALH